MARARSVTGLRLLADSISGLPSRVKTVAFSAVFKQESIKNKNGSYRYVID
jgi:hypothetical protein